MPFRVDSRHGVWGDIVAAHPAWGDTLLAVRNLVARLDPDAVEAASVRQNNVWWGLGPGKMTDGYAYAMPAKARV